MRVIHRVFAPLLLLLLSSAAYAVTYIVPPDAEMIQRSDDVVVATGVKSFVERNADGAIVTRYTLQIEDVIKGQRAVGDHLVLTERGGELDGHITYIPGTPSYEPGERYLVFTESNRDGEPVTFGMGLGQFFFARQNGRLLVLRGELEGFNNNLDAHVETARDATLFVEYVRGIVAQRVDPEPHYFVARANARWQPETHGNVSALAGGRGAYLMSSGGRFFRWSTPTAAIKKSGTPNGPNGNAAVALSFSQWNGTASNINYTDGGQDDTATGGIKSNVDTADGKNAILFDDPNNQVGSGIAGVGGITDAGNQYTLDGENFWAMIEVDVVMNNGSFAQNCYNTVMVHEVGHTLGFKHAAESPQQADAIMNWQVMCSWNGVLKQYDKDAAATVYGSGPVCVAPGISTQPANKSITPPATASLTVTATGTAPLTYQWYIGETGDTSQPVGTNSSTLPSLSPAVTTKYWVRVTGNCGTPADSSAATVTVTECVPASVATQPQPKTINAPGSTSLSVEAAGTGPFTYEWFIGERNDTSNPVPNSNKTSINVSPATTTTYWVRITGACGAPTSSVTAVVTVNPCAAVLVGTPTATPSGSNAILSVEASSDAVGILTYAWFRGNTPGSGGAAVGTQKTITVAVTEVASYWVRVTNSCNNRTFSDLVTVAPCELPAIATQPADQTIASGTGATLSLSLAGNGAGTVVTWYRGSVPDKSNLLGNGTSINVGPLTETTSYWATVKNTCGEVPSRTVLVTVTTGPVCIAPAITTPPLSQEVKANTAATLSVIATGTATLQYQWFTGTMGDTTEPVGTNAPTFTSEKILKTSLFWVQVTNACGTVDSEAARITVPPGRRRGVRH
jgi:hypothetical protein